MKIAILNGSPRTKNTAAMVNAFAEGAKEAGHEVDILHVGKMQIKECLGCEYCHKKGNGTCIQKDDMQNVLPMLNEADMLVFATPVYYRSITTHLSVVIHRMYPIGKSKKATKSALLVSSLNPGTWKSIEFYYRDLLELIGLEDCGIRTLYGEERESEEKLAEIRAFAKTL
ncbi:flavodoxin family protein [Selenomonas ruminantium]|jgi:multimeric flavodoxin WrbA|uniref:NADPH-dependent FMN reductase n=1 Tax=Selenomonas ruminantium TaxID=971 RepID=A0A1I0V2T6_SELRU|nr:flavodoxin family protein [Selenomonas ruminantium]SFA70638.1 NADPH-dependent FMN reductase [Selenomonas ruminantium]